MTSHFPLRIRLWYFAHNYAERLWHWIWFARLKPWHDAQDVATVPPTYRLFDERAATEAEQARGISAVRTYVGHGGYGETPPVRDDGRFNYKLTYQATTIFRPASETPSHTLSRRSG